MCGIAGFAGILDKEVRLVLASVLGWGIDSRGGDSCGYLSLGDTIRYGRKSGTYLSASDKFLNAACGHIYSMLHARWATCEGVREDPNDAHPFAIKREGKTVLWGAHNGVLQGARESAEKHARPYTVDSREMFELLADEDYKGLAGLQGYGVITWVRADSPGYVRLCRISKDSEVEVVTVEGGGTVWASTEQILEDALETAGLKVKHRFHLKPGKVYELTPHGVYLSKDRGFTVASRSYFSLSNLNEYLGKGKKEVNPYNLFDQLSYEADEDTFIAYMQATGGG